MSNRYYEDHDTAEDKIIKDAKTVGWSVVMIESTSYLPSFAYTIGLWKNYQHPEIILFGLKLETLHSTLNIAGEKIKAGGHYETGQIYSDFFTNGDAQVISVDKRSIGDYFGYAMWFNGGHDFPAMELVWTDRNNRFPWETSFENEFLYSQPLLDRNADFKFMEEKNLAVFTTRQWLEEDKPIVRVMHDKEGDWQFLTGDQMPEDIRIVCLYEIVSRDITLNDVFNLDYGDEAERKFLNDKWERK